MMYGRGFGRGRRGGWRGAGGWPEAEPVGWSPRGWGRGRGWAPRWTPAAVSAERVAWLKQAKAHLEARLAELEQAEKTGTLPLAPAGDAAPWGGFGWGGPPPWARRWTVGLSEEERQAWLVWAKSQVQARLREIDAELQALTSEAAE